MQQNPYAGGGDPQFDYYEEPQRTSLLAIFSLCSLLCCLPGVGVLGMLLGGLSLAFIGASHGRLAGKGIALAGLMVGLMVTTIQGAIAFGLVQAYTYYEKQMVPAAEAVVVAIGANDLTTVQQAFTGGDDITIEQMDRFQSILVGEIGGVQGVSASFGEVWATFVETFSGRSQGSQINVQGTDDAQPVPFVIVGDSGRVLGWAIFDVSTANTSNLQLLDLLVLLPGKTESFSLRSSDVARDISLRLGAQMLRADETSSSVAPPSAPASIPDAPAAEEKPAETPAEPPV